MKDHALDNAIADPKTFATENGYHEIFNRLRKEDPVHWTVPDGFRPFWTVSKHADIMEIELQNDRFLNGPRTILQSEDVEQRILEETGGGQALFRTLVQMDNPDHRAYRGMTQAWFMPPNLKKLESDIRALAKEYVDRLEDMNGECDFVSDLAVWYPLRVIMTILGVPPEDEPLMLKLTQEIFGSTDPEMNETQDAAQFETAAKLFEYFRQVTEERRKNPRDDVATVIANATIDGELIGEFEALSYYVIVATAGHDTTSSSVGGGMLALLQNPEQLTKLRTQPDLLPQAIDEMIRWTTPEALLSNGSGRLRVSREKDQRRRQFADVLLVGQSRRGGL